MDGTKNYTFSQGRDGFTEGKQRNTFISKVQSLGDNLSDLLQAGSMAA